MKRITSKFTKISLATTSFLLTASSAFAQITNPVVPDLADESAAEAAASGELFGQYLSQILSLVVLIAGIMLLVMLIWGGVEWITSGGDKGKVESATKRITQAILGMIVLAGAIAIFSLMQSFLGFEILTFSGGGGANSTPTPIPTIPPAPPNMPQPT